MNRTVKIAVAALVLGAGSGGVAVAGLKWSQGSVDIDLAARLATGQLPDVRAGSDPREYVGCVTTARAGSLPSVTCYAETSTTFNAWCVSEDAGLVEQARALHGDSGLTFRWDANHACTEISVENASFIRPKPQ